MGWEKGGPERKVCIVGLKKGFTLGAEGDSEVVMLLFRGWSDLQDTLDGCFQVG